MFIETSASGAGAPTMPHTPSGASTSIACRARRDAGRLQRAVDAAAAGELHQRLDGVLLARVDDVGGAEPGRELEPRRVDVDDRGGRAGEVHGRDEGAEADAAGAEDRERRAGFGAQDVEHGLRAGLHAAGERAEQLERRVARAP